MWRIFSAYLSSRSCAKVVLWLTIGTYKRGQTGHNLFSKGWHGLADG